MKIFEVQAKEEYFSPRTEDRSHRHPSLHPYEDLVDSGHLRCVRKDDLVLYCYTPQTTYERRWDEYTMKARGIIFDSKTGECVCNPMPKFFNEFELEPLGINIDFNQPYKSYDKIDGSLIHVFYYKDRWWVTSKGSFESPQALKAAEIFERDHKERFDNLEFKDQCYRTFVFEVIYPSNKIVVDYGDKEELVLLTIRNNEQSIDYKREHIQLIASGLRLKLVEELSENIEEIKELCKTRDENWEGAVHHFADGSRMKSKNLKYLEVHKVVSECSPLALWESMKNGKVMHIELLPEEHRAEIQEIADILEDRYSWLRHQIFSNFLTAMNKVGFEDRKQLATWLFNKSNGIAHPHMVFSVLDGHENVINKYIMDKIRPKGNVL